MELYTLLREFADSWMLLAMTLFFIGVIIFVFRPGSRKADRNAAGIVFRHEDKPASDEVDPSDAAARLKEARQ